MAKPPTARFNNYHNEKGLYMSKNAILVLEDGSIYHGFSFGAETDAVGEVVFNTGMFGYQEMLTDPASAGQIIITTYPLIGNSGINKDDAESKRVHAKALIVKEDCVEPSHHQADKTLSDYLKENGICGIYGMDTRAITKKVRNMGALMGAVSVNQTPQEALAAIKSMPRYADINLVQEVSTKEVYKAPSKTEKVNYKVALLDCGVKQSTLDMMAEEGCEIEIYPHSTTAQEILATNPDLVVIAGGPGNPAKLRDIAETIRQFVDAKPIFGIGLGCELIAHSFSCRTTKLKFGHHGANHPVKCLKDGTVHIAAQNHGFSIEPTSLRYGLNATHINLNDKTVEGIEHETLAISGVSYTSESSPGPGDVRHIFRDFLQTKVKA